MCNCIAGSVTGASVCVSVLGRHSSVRREKEVTGLLHYADDGGILGAACSDNRAQLLKICELSAARRRAFRSAATPYLLHVHAARKASNPDAELLMVLDRFFS